MPGATETVELILKCTNAQFTQALNRTDSQLAGLSRSIGLVAAAGASLFVAHQGVRLFDASVGSAIEFESQLANVRKTTGMSGAALEKLQGQLAKLSTTFAGFKFGELIQVAEMGSRLGLAGDKVADFARDIGFLTTALDGVSADAAAAQIGRLNNVFKLGTENTIRWGAAFNVLDDISSATASEIMNITTRLSGAASTLGMSPQKTAALATAMRDAGIQVEVAGTAMSQSLARMATAPEKFAEVAGVSMERFARTMRQDPLQALAAFEKGLKRNTV